jgi:hypothetical protein
MPKILLNFIFNEGELFLILLEFLEFDKDIVRSCRLGDKQLLEKSKIVGDLLEDPNWWFGGKNKSLINIHHYIKDEKFYLIAPILSGDSKNTLENIRDDVDFDSIRGNCSECGGEVHECDSERANQSDCICKPKYDETHCIVFSCVYDKKYIEKNFRSIIKTLSSMSTMNCSNIVISNLPLSWLWYKIFGEQEVIYF